MRYKFTITRFKPGLLGVWLAASLFFFSCSLDEATSDTKRIITDPGQSNITYRYGFDKELNRLVYQGEWPSALMSCEANDTRLTYEHLKLALSNLRPENEASHLEELYEISDYGLLFRSADSSDPVPDLCSFLRGLTEKSITSTNSQIVELSAGSFHTCGITQEGRAYCWGKGADGRLGNGDRWDRLVPIKVSGDLSFKTITAGKGHTCALTQESHAYCWGRGDYGQLGTGDLSDRLVPSRVFGDLRFRSITAGSYHTCGIAQEGHAYCWGRGDYGRLGTGDLWDRVWPSEVLGDFTFSSVTAGGEHTCGITSGGNAYCWGWGDSGNLGNGDIEPSLVPSEVSTNLTFSSITAGYSHVCGITQQDSRAYCWGKGEDGRLGNGEWRNFLLPGQVSGDYTYRSITAGSSHTCGINQEGRAYCWGKGDYGRLGNGDRERRLLPKPVAMVDSN